MNGVGLAEKDRPRIGEAWTSYCPGAGPAARARELRCPVEPNGAADGLTSRMLGCRLYSGPGKSGLRICTVSRGARDVMAMARSGGAAQPCPCPWGGPAAVAARARLRLAPRRPSDI